MTTDTEPTSSPSESGTPGTVGRALQLLGVLADADGSVTVKHVSEAMHVAPSTAHRLLNLLKKEGFVESSAESRQYAIGPAFYRVAARVMSSVSTTTIAQPVMEAIADEFDETVLFGVYLPAEQALSFASRADGRQRLTYRVDMHRPLSLVWGASGRAVLAFLPDAVISAIVANEGKSPATGAPPMAESVVREDLQRIRERGWALSESEKLPDARGIAAPVFGPSGVVGSLCLTTPIVRQTRVSVEAIGQSMAAYGRKLSRYLGAPPH